jgi:hypothetical protein
MSIKSFIFIALSMLYSTQAFGGEEVATLLEGQAAPFDGTIFNTEASARLLIDLELTSEACDVRISESIERSQARYQLDIDILTASRDSIQQRYDDTLLIKNNQIDWLERQAARPGSSKQLWFVVGILTGSAITIGSGYALHQISN